VTSKLHLELFSNEVFREHRIKINMLRDRGCRWCVDRGNDLYRHEPVCLGSHVNWGVCGLATSVHLFCGTVINAFENHVSRPWTAIAVFSMIFSTLGCLSGRVFWLVARPDRSWSE